MLWAAGFFLAFWKKGQYNKGEKNFLERRSEEHTSELQSRQYLVCRLLLEKKNVALTVGVFLLLFGAGLWAFTRMGHRFAMVERGVGLVKKKRRIAFSVFFFNDTATTEIYTLSLHDALPIFAQEGQISGNLIIQFYFALIIQFHDGKQRSRSFGQRSQIKKV